MGTDFRFVTPPYLSFGKEEKVEKREFCANHFGYLLNSYCEDCDSVVCLNGKINSHNSHNIITLEQKCKQMKARMNDTLKTSLSPNTLKGKLDFLKEETHEIEKATTKSKEEMRHQYQNVTSQLNYLLNKQTNVLDIKKRDQISHLNREIENMKKNLQQMETREAEIKNLLLQQSSVIFVKQCKEVLRKLELSPKELESRRPSWGKPTYIPPQGPSVYSEEFLTFCENNILGYFADERTKMPDFETLTHAVSMEDSRNFIYERDNLSKAATEPGIVSTATARSVTATSVNFSATTHPHSSLTGDELWQNNVIDELVSVNKEHIIGTETRKRHGISPELNSHVDRKSFDSGHLRIFSDAVFMDKSVWVCGWTRNIMSKNDTVLVNVEGLDFS